jgi:hypothetical protein
VLEFELSKQLEQVMISIGIMTIESVAVITYWSQPKDLPAGRYRVEALCDLLLAAGDLQFAIGLSHDGRVFSYMPGVGHVSISEIALDKQPFRASRSGILVSLQRPEIMPIEQQHVCIPNL